MAAHEGSISGLLEPAKKGDEQALSKLHARYLPMIVNRARRKLGVAPLRHVSAEDIAQEAFTDCFLAFREGRLPAIINRGQLMAFLTHVVSCKAANQIKRAMRQRHDERRNVFPEALEALVQDQAPRPDQELLARDCLQYFLSCLPQQLREVAEMQIAGLDKVSIAEQIGRKVRTVERKLRLLQEHWRELVADSIDRDLSELSLNHDKS